MKTLLFMFSIMLLRSCGGPTEYQSIQELQKDTTILKPLNGIYNITHMQQENVSTFKLSITFDKNTREVSGVSGCNRFFGTYSLNKNTIKFGALGSTKRLCSEDKNKIERQFIATLEKADAIYFSADGFSLFHKKTELLTAEKVIKHRALSFEYSAASRGTRKTIIINKDFVIRSNKKKGSAIKLANTPQQWQTLVKLCDTISIQTISELNAPSKKFQFDGAPLAHLTITLNGETYESAPFDHENPPLEIAALVKEILSIAQNIE